MIHDQFSKRTDVSRQRRYQLRQQAAGRCPICGEEAETGRHFCARHRAEREARDRRRRRPRG
jgi:hypothetical protein